MLRIHRKLFAENKWDIGEIFTCYTTKWSISHLGLTGTSASTIHHSF